MENKRQAYVAELEQVHAASMAESKSSAGDKYETAREMLAQTRRILEKSEAETLALLVGLDRMLLSDGSGPIHFGSLLRLENTWYLVGLNLGSLEDGEREVLGISLQSPLGLALKGRQMGDSIAWRDKNLVVRELDVD